IGRRGAELAGVASVAACTTAVDVGLCAVGRPVRARGRLAGAGSADFALTVRSSAALAVCRTTRAPTHPPAVRFRFAFVLHDVRAGWKLADGGDATAALAIARVRAGSARGARRAGSAAAVRVGFGPVLDTVFAAGVLAEPWRTGAHAGRAVGRAGAPLP